MKKFIAFTMAAIMVIITFSVLVINADDDNENSVYYNKHVQVDYYWANDFFVDRVDHKIYLSETRYEMADYQLKSVFYRNQDCFTLESMLNYSDWFIHQTGYVDPYSIPVKVAYTVNYLRTPTPLHHEYSYIANDETNLHSYNVWYNRSSIVSSIYVYHMVNMPLENHYNSDYSSYMITIIYSI